MTDDGELTIYDGRTCIGLLKPLRGGGFETFVIRDDEPVYVAKAVSAKEGGRLIREARAPTADAHQPATTQDCRQ